MNKPHETQALAEESNKKPRKKIDTNSLLKNGESVKEAATRRLKRVKEIDEMTATFSEERRRLMDEYNHLERKLLRSSIEAQVNKS